METERGKAASGPTGPEPERRRLIVVEDDPVTRSMIAHYFVKAGFDVEEARDGAECRALLSRGTADLLLIDIQLPDIDGISLARDIRASSAVGIIFVTQRDNEVDRVVGLELAADDYVTKPVNLRELLARARALLRRRRLDGGAGRPGQTPVAFGPWVLDPARRALTTREGVPIQLTRGEFDLLAALVAADGQPLHRDDLTDVVSNRNSEGESRTIDSLIARIRRKLAPTAGGKPVIVTVTGVGYKLGVTRGAPP